MAETQTTMDVVMPAIQRGEEPAKKKLQQLSVFFPAYNEEKNVPIVVAKALKVLPRVAEEYEAIIVNDGSRDRTGEVAEQLFGAQPCVRVISHEKNRGYGAALRTGFRAARYPWVAFTDSDAQFDFADIEQFIPYTDSADLILGYRLHRADSVLRRLFTFGWALIPRILLGLDVKDYSCGFKLIKKSVIEAVEPLQGEEKVYQIELLVKAKRKGFKFAEVGVHHYPRTFGKQTGANLKVVLRSLGEMLDLYRRLRHRVT
jgi:glycosyltransferase involved in cell wall biosynthesis